MRQHLKSASICVETEGVGAIIEQSFKRVERQCDVGGVLTRGVLVLKTRSEGKADQGLLPFVGEGSVITVATSQHHSAKLGDDSERVL